MPRAVSETKILTVRNLAKIPALNGLYACIAAPIVYFFFGRTRRLAVLPEAAISLMVGDAIRKIVAAQSDDGEKDQLQNASDMACLITFLAGVITLAAALFRTGYIDIIGSPVLLSERCHLS